MLAIVSDAIKELLILKIYRSLASFEKQKYLALLDKYFKPEYYKT